MVVGVSSFRYARKKRIVGVIAVNPAKPECVVEAADGIELVFGVDAALPFRMLRPCAAVGGDLEVFGAEFLGDLIGHVALHLAVAGHECASDGDLDPAARAAGVIDGAQAGVRHRVDRPLQNCVIRKSAGFNVHHGIVQRLKINLFEQLFCSKQKKHRFSDA